MLKASFVTLAVLAGTLVTAAPAAMAVSAGTCKSAEKAAASVTPATSKAVAPVRFQMETIDQRKFVIELTDQARIDHARRILRGEEKNRVHVHGRIMKRPAAYNPGWSFHLDPTTIGFFEVAIEVCDATTQYVEDHLDEVCGAFLPGCHWCPWTSRLVSEVTTS
ncbi:BP74-related protein [Herbidospora yilanensis]|uniref:BP74-related protein n=1 Tax=Herbidospora yilanensis TaxID=354426 RepID=UPI000B1E7436|nr:calmodulin-binding protein [Herbidospora yilanensis]